MLSTNNTRLWCSAPAGSSVAVRTACVPDSSPLRCAACSGAICGNADRIDNLLTVRQTLSNYGNRAGKRLTVAVGITQTTVANTIQTGKKTADCLGRTGTDRRCKYIY